MGKHKYKKKVDLNKIINKRYNFLILIIIILMSILSCGLFYVQIIKHEYYKDKLISLTTNIIYGESAPRGRIYDSKGRVIVDNKAVNVIEYRKLNGITSKEEIELAYKLADILDVDYSNLTKNNMKEFWLLNNKKESKNLITDEEYKLEEMRKITSNDIKKLKLERISDNLLNYSELDKEAIYIYFLMNKGYYSDTKIIKRNASDIEYVTIAENEYDLNGIKASISWDRYYPYGKTFRTILGSVSITGIPSELKEHYLSQGLNLNDRVGISYLEYQYDKELRGSKNKYQVEKDGSLTLIEEGTKGNDIVLTIDIELQKEVENIIENQIKYAKEKENMIYYDKSYVIITEPKTGSILTMAGIQVLNDGLSYKTYDYSAGIVTSPITAGSAVKGASHIVGYNTGALKIGEVRMDECIKIAATPKKCSWRALGQIDDIKALKYSSNIFQFKTAMNVGKASYRYNAPLPIDESAFDIYRNTFAMFGLGVSTGIDLPLESLGYKGSSKLPGHLLDFAIGQYDNYTPIMLSQYIDTIANDGVRMQKHLLKEIHYNDGTIINYENKELNKVETDSIYMNRVKEGFKEVMNIGGTGYGYINNIYRPAGKTGTSESFLDTDNDGNIDTETLSNTFVAYAPYENPKVTFTIISPDIGYYRGGRTIKSYVNKRITNEVVKKYFEIYE